MRPEFAQEATSLMGVASMAHLNYKDKGSTVEAQMGLLNKAMTSSAVADITSFARNIAPVGNKVRTFGGSQIEGLALASALSTALNDQTGQLVDTSAANILGKLSMVENRFGIDPTGKSILQRQDFIRSNDPKAAKARQYLLGQFAADAETLTDADRQLMTDAQLNKRLIPKLGGKAKTLYTAMQFFQPTGKADGPGSLNDLFRSAIEEIGGVYSKPGVVDQQATYKAAAASLRKTVEFANTSPLFKSETNLRTTDEATEGILQGHGNPLAGQMADSQSAHGRMMTSAGRSILAGILARTSATLAGSESYGASLRRQRDEIQAQQQSIIDKHLRTRTFEYGSQGMGLVGLIQRRSLASSLATDPTVEQLRKYNLPQDEVNAVMKLEAKLDQVTEAIDRTNMELKGLRNDGQKPRKVELNNAQPQEPAAKAIGR